MLDSIISWCDPNKLTVNVKITKCLYINSDNIDNNALDAVNHFECLGMHIDNKLYVGKHFKIMMKKATRKFEKLM